MKSKKLAKNNQYLMNPSIAKQMRIKSVASSTAIETGESIENLESKVLHQKRSRYSVKLA